MKQTGSDGFGAMDVVKADIAAHKWAWRNRKEIAAVANTVNNAVNNKKTTIGAIGVIIGIIGAGMVQFGDGTIDYAGIAMELLGALKVAYALFNARDADKRGEDQAPPA